MQLRKLRRNAKMLQSDLAKKMKVSQSRISKMERGLAEPSLTELRKIRNIFKVDLNKFVYKFKLK